MFGKSAEENDWILSWRIGDIPVVASQLWCAGFFGKPLFFLLLFLGARRFCFAFGVRHIKTTRSMARIMDVLRFLSLKTGNAYSIDRQGILFVFLFWIILVHGLSAIPLETYNSDL